MDSQDLKNMHILFDEARQSGKEDVPITAMLTHNAKPISLSSNFRERNTSPMSHAEMIVIEEASRKLSSWRLLDTCLYVLVEPCLMCTGAIYAARIPRVVFGVTNPKGGCLLHVQSNRKALGINHCVDIEHGYLQEEIKALLSGYFQNKRKK